MNSIKEALHNASKDCTGRGNIGSIARDKNIAQVYGAGIVNGVVASLMAFHDVRFETAMRMLYQLVKDDHFDLTCLPDSWLADFYDAQIEIDNRV